MKSKVLAIYAMFGATWSFGVSQTDASPIYLLALILATGGRFNKFRLEILICVVAILIFISTIYGSILLFKAAAQFVLAFLSINLIMHHQYLLTWIPRLSWLWMTTGLITLVEPFAFEALNYRVGWTPGRGAVGVTPEPAYYGLASTFFCALAMQGQKTCMAIPNRNALIFAFSTLISGSAYAIITLVTIMLIYRDIVPKRLLVYIFSLGVTAAAITFALSDPNQIRAFVLIKSAISNPEALLADASVAYRLNSIQDLFNILAFGEATNTGLGTGVTALILQLSWFAFPLLVLIGISLGLHRLRIKSIYLTIVLAVIFTLGPLSIPAFWFWIASLQKTPLKLNS